MSESARMPVVHANGSAATLRRQSSELGLLFDGVLGVTLSDAPNGTAIVVVDAENHREAVELMNRLIQHGLVRPA